MSSAILSPLLHPMEAGLVALDEGSLTRAFASFTEAAASLERSYVQLQAEVARLRHELEDTKVMQQLLREQVSIRDLSTILEALLDTGSVNKNPVLLAAAAREA